MSRKHTQSLNYQSERLQSTSDGYDADNETRGSKIPVIPFSWQTKNQHYANGLPNLWNEPRHPDEHHSYQDPLDTDDHAELAVMYRIEQARRKNEAWVDAGCPRYVDEQTNTWHEFEDERNHGTPIPSLSQEEKTIQQLYDAGLQVLAVPADKLCISVGKDLMQSVRSVSLKILRKAVMFQQAIGIANKQSLPISSDESYARTAEWVQDQAARVAATVVLPPAARARRTMIGLKR